MANVRALREQLAKMAPDDATLRFFEELIDMVELLSISYQAPRQELGSMAFQSKDHVEIRGGIVQASTLTNSNASYLVSSLVALNDFSAANVATLNNSPRVGNPLKWIPIIDNGTQRYIPTW